MKKLFYFILVAGLSLATASCQIIDEQVSGQKLNVTGTIVNFESTKVSYVFSETGNPKSGLKASWEVDDEIFGFDDKGGGFTFTVSEVKDGKAIFYTDDYTPAEGVTELYAVYYPGKTAFDGNNELAVDLSNQDGSLGSDSPAIMCATGTIEDGNVSFDFTNQTSIVGIYKMQIKNGDTPVANTTITGVTLNNVATTGTVKLDEGKLALVPGTGVSSISVSGLSLTTDSNGYINVDPSALAPYFAVIPANVKMSISATDGITAYNNITSISRSNLNVGTYYYIGKQMGTDIVAKIGNVGYATIDDAFEAANNMSGASEIKLLADCSPAAPLDVKNKITLDLNDCTLSEFQTNRIEIRDAKGELTVKDSGLDPDKGILENTGLDHFAIHMNAGILNIESGTIMIPSSCKPTGSGVAPIWVNGDKAAIVNISGGVIKGAESVTQEAADSYALYVKNIKATLSISGGTFSSQGACVKVAGAKSDSDEPGVSITGGNYTSNKATFYFSGAEANKYICNIAGTVEISSGSNPIYVPSNYVIMNVSGGKYLSTKDVAMIYTDTSTPEISVTGGEFSKAPNSSYVDAFHKIVGNNDDVYKMKVVDQDDDVTLQIGNSSPRPCGTVEGAVTEANKVSEACVITLNKDLKVGASATVTNSAGVTLDLNGHTLTHEGGNRVGVKDSGKLIIDDTNTDGGGMIIQTTNGSSTITYGAGELIVNGGTITHSTGSTFSTLNLTGGTLIVNGGTISNNAAPSSPSNSNNRAAVNLSGTSTSVTINGGTIESSGWRALHTTGGTVTMTGGTITSSAAYSAIGIDGGSVTIDEAEGKTVTISAPEMPSSSATVGVVRLISGSLTLNAGTIGKANGNGDNGNFTALDIEGGTFKMTGGFVVARRFPIYFRTAGSATISGGQLRNSYSGYNAIRFNTDATSTLTLQGDAHLCTLSNATLTGTLFGTASGTSGNKTVPSTASVTINGGYYYVSPEGYTNVTINGAVTTGSWSYDGRTYKYKVE